MWLLAPSLVVAPAMLVGHNAWLAMLSFHAFLIVALLVHRRQIDWQNLLKPPPAGKLFANLAIACLVMSLVSWAMVAYANRHGGYGPMLDRGLSAFAVEPGTRILFAIQLCLLNPLLEELFWRGLFFSSRKRIAATDVCYAAYHFFALVSFMPVLLAVVGTVGLVAVGYSLRQLAARNGGRLTPSLLWHALGDVAVVVAIARLTEAV